MVHIPRERADNSISLPPQKRKFVTCSITAPAIHLKDMPKKLKVSSHPYKNFVLFYEDTTEHVGFSSAQSIESVFIQTLNRYYTFTGRLFKDDCSIINQFEKGALFEVIDSTNLFTDYSNREFLQNSLPQLVSLTQYHSRDSALCGLRLTRLRDGGIVIGISLFRHVTDIADELNFLQLFCSLGKNGNHDTAPLNLLWHHQIPIQADESTIVYTKSRKLSMVVPYSYTKTSLSSLETETASIVHILDI
ncbi:hypothetical protein BDF21DRAFT_430317 [Thamnidium elegans]|uniref:Uncharacterized protein n=1 Tax=Thamnidium elegans TaxID=101142 RepID=A0A8H7VWG3_9FUNG|nr:hypothetical protein INT48_009277 [Thamnidium elegans]KAI8057405.1 hypothetical protein BDF21DRAFT_430317 [Thamnidium elegans]